MATEVDIIELLERDHRRIDGLAERLDSAVDTAEITELYRQIVDAMSVHEAIEHELLFPALQTVLAATDDTTIDARMAEHEELNALLAEMRDLDPAAFAFIKRGSALLLEMEGHFAREEESVFTLVRTEIPAEELIDLGRRALALKDTPTP